MNKKNYIIAILILILGVTAIIYWRMKPETSNTVNETQNSTTTANENPTPPPTTATFNYELIMEPLDGETVTFDASIVRTNNTTKEKTTLIKSVKQAYPPLQKTNNLTLQKLIFPQKGTKIYFTIILMDTDAGASGIVSFDTQTKQFKELAVSKYFSSFTSTAAESVPYIASTHNPKNNTDERTLYLLDLDKDTVNTLTTLSKNETFNSCWENNCFSGYLSTIEWTSDTAFNAYVYDPTKKSADSEGYDTNKLIEKRTFTIK